MHSFYCETWKRIRSLPFFLCTFQFSPWTTIGHWGSDIQLFVSSFFSTCHSIEWAKGLLKRKQSQRRDWVNSSPFEVKEKKYMWKKRMRRSWKFSRMKKVKRENETEKNKRFTTVTLGEKKRERVKSLTMDSQDTSYWLWLLTGESQFTFSNIEKKSKHFSNFCI